MKPYSNYDEFFKRALATENGPFPYQVKLATDDLSSITLSVPTGLGKTAGAVLAWLWKRRMAVEEVRRKTPRRLVYCLPMRVLVEQTRDNTIYWLKNLGLLDGTAEIEGRNGAFDLRQYTPSFSDPEKISVHIVMGGEDEDDWDIYPERDVIIIGTQDMLLSRLLNRGYAVSRSRWPIQFGLLNTDCLWVFDEIQLMGAGLATTSQLEAFRRTLPCYDNQHEKTANGCRSIWMSATIQREWLETVDFAHFLKHTPEHIFNFEREIKTNGIEEKTRKTLQDRWNATKPLLKAEAIMGDAAGLAREVRKCHKPGTRTIIVVNTVKRGCDLFDALNIDDSASPKKGSNAKRAKEPKQAEGFPEAPSRPQVVLLHSRFRPEDRKKRLEEALAKIEPGDPGTIVVSTQVIEAGVDVSATTLFTELAPWASLIQRFGRCNRRGEENSEANVLWIDLPSKEPDAEKLALPYQLTDLIASAEQLKKLTDVGLRSLPEVPLPFEHSQVIRRKDLIDLFDTTPDLAGNDIDIDRFVREVDDSDVRVFWRDWDQTDDQGPPEDEPAARRKELCPAPIGELRDFAKKQKGRVWRWNFLDKEWEKPEPEIIAPGQVFLLHCSAGGYSPERGWGSDSEYVEPIMVAEADPPDSTDAEPLSQVGVWQTISEHTAEVCNELTNIVDALGLTEVELAEALRDAARWHDRGKAHHVFQNAIDDGQIVERNARINQRLERPEIWRGCRFLAKAPDKRWENSRVVDQGFWRRYDWLPNEGRKHFRHELASALAVLLSSDDIIPPARRDLVAYLVAAHHGKVRLSIRSLPNESRPSGDQRFARGVWDGDELPATDLGDGLIAPAVTLSLEPIELGLGERKPFTGQPSWAERMISLRHELGPFRLAFLEAILRAADMRASRAAVQREAAKLKAQVITDSNEVNHA